MSGNVKNDLGDLNLVAIYINNEKVETIPDGSYLIDRIKSKCTINGDVDNNITFEVKNNKIGIYGITRKNTKCNIYIVNNPLDKIIATVRSEKPDFSKTSCLAGTNSDNHTEGDCGEETNGLYKETTSLGDTYYYRGTVNNNWVKYGTNAEGQPIWWRIIRINEDKTIRIIYTGEGSDAPASDENGYWMSNSYGINNKEYKFNNSNEHNAYVGYMYGTPESDSFVKEHGYDLIDNGNVNQLQNSNIKTVIDEWYQKNLADEGEVLSGSAGFCGDRTLAEYKPEGYTNRGYGIEKTYYKAYDRIIINKKPSFECPDNAHDLYTTKIAKGTGNGVLDYPISLITADEAAYAGGINGTNYGYWLRTSMFYYTFSPYVLEDYASVFGVSSVGRLYIYHTVRTLSARPVVNVLPEYFKTENKDGTINNPYIVEEV